MRPRFPTGPRPLAGLAVPVLTLALFGTACGDEGPAEPELDELAIVTTSLPAGVQGVPYSQMLEATGGDGSYRWRIIGAMSLGSPPAGLWLGTDGELSGTPAFVETQGFTVEVRSGDGQVATRALSLTIDAPPE